MTQKKKLGRPAKPEAEKSQTVNFTMRMRPQLMNELRKSADAANRSISAEAERRLSQPVANEVGHFVSRAISSVEDRIGKSWDQDHDSKAFCWAAAEAALRLLLGDRPGEDDFLEQLTASLSGLPSKTDEQRLKDFKLYVRRMVTALETVETLRSESDK